MTFCLPIPGKAEKLEELFTFMAAKTKTVHNGEQAENNVTIEHAVAFALAARRDVDDIGDHIDTVLANVQSIRPGTTEPDLREYLSTMEKKKLIRVKPCGFIRVEHGKNSAIQRLAEVAASA